MRVGALIIGDEILLGRREDLHLRWLIGALRVRGLRLRWASYVGDDRAALTAILRRTFAEEAVVFAFGGIGATPDDHTRAAAAAALERPLVLHPEAERLIRARFGAETTPERLEMGRFPEGAEIIPNPYNQIPGFSIERHHFVPGFPRMAWPMVEWVLDRYYREEFGEDWTEGHVVAWDVREGELLPLMASLTAQFPAATLFSLPTLKEDAGGRWRLELGFRGPREVVAEALAALRVELRARGVVFEEGSERVEEEGPNPSP
ncbi:MAG: competence/damage-inducible protein A [Hydrogenophilus sp.]|nr:competence/damage-inducible protein A [Hydrogenophilus sp.]